MQEKELVYLLPHEGLVSSKGEAVRVRLRHRWTLTPLGHHGERQETIIPERQVSGARGGVLRSIARSLFHIFSRTNLNENERLE